MAVNTNTTFSIASGAPPTAVGSFNKFDMHATPKYAVGYKVEQADGSVYRYSHFGADTNRGVLVSQDVSESSVVDTDNKIIAPASAVAVPGESVKPGTIGSRYVEITLASVTANKFVGGKFVTTDDTGEGYTYDIIDHTITGDPATGNFRIKLAEPLQVALDATTDFAIQGNLYSNLEVATAATDIAVAGVSCSTVDFSEAPYAWIQVKGQVGILTDTTPPAIGDISVLSSEVAGAVMKMGGTAAATIGDVNGEEIIGTCLIAGDSTGHGVYKINIS